MFSVWIFPETLKGLRYFGLSDDTIFIFILIAGMLASYFLLRPVTRLLLRWRAETLLNYILSSLIVTVLLLIWLYIGDSIQQLRVALLSLAGFGILLMVTRSIGRIWRNV